jgi:hypothetical protein
MEAATQMYQCSKCNADMYQPGVCDECSIPPDDYIKPGTPTLVYLNAYEVTRHYGGPEEGGWWYDHREPVASIPIPAMVHEGHQENSCRHCDGVRAGIINDTYCDWSFHILPVSDDHVEFFEAYLEELYGNRREGDISSVLGGLDIRIVLEENPGERTGRPQYE